MQRICECLITKWKIHESQQAIVTDEEKKESDSDLDFGLLYDPALYVKFDDKIRFAELLKQADRDKLTAVVKLLKQHDSNSQNVIESVSNDRI